jgi:aminocarboxymuconate-semialdehyde decarboxylase
MLAQCADAYHFLTLNGYPDKYPGMRVCFAHGGQLAQMNLGRRIQGFDGRPDLFEGKVHPRKSVAHPNIFFDTLVHDTGSLALLVKNQTSKQVLVGLDDPYPLGEMESEKQSSYPGKLLDLAIDEGVIDQQDADEMWDENVVSWLFGKDEAKKKAFYDRILT